MRSTSLISTVSISIFLVLIANTVKAQPYNFTKYHGKYNVLSESTLDCEKNPTYCCLQGQVQVYSSVLKDCFSVSGMYSYKSYKNCGVLDQYFIWTLEALTEFSGKVIEGYYNTNNTVQLSFISNGKFPVGYYRIFMEISPDGASFWAYQTK